MCPKCSYLSRWSGLPQAMVGRGDVLPPWLAGGRCCKGGGSCGEPGRQHCDRAPPQVLQRSTKAKVRCCSPPVLQRSVKAGGGRRLLPVLRCSTQEEVGLLAIGVVLELLSRHQSCNGAPHEVAMEHHRS
ncbi:hypothetical protein CFC21_067069 [Triticum aestivum]|uniref:Uncharacterized protein n=2 Tax=Triticum aestivum TaxID=4565 RepID=A0A3B6KKY2_WHEAT|nr:hypothetical protein CFC21_067069 [Triticum aestivum]